MSRPSRNANGNAALTLILSGAGRSHFFFKWTSVPLIPKFAPEVPQGFADFEIGPLEPISVEWMQNRGASVSAVIAGLDPAIHLFARILMRRTRILMRRRWTRGSSPRVTLRGGQGLH
jgi:hypothetical protein